MGLSLRAHRQTSSRWLIIVGVLGALLLFIAAPVGTVLFASFETPAALDERALLERTRAMLELLPGAERERRLQAWWQSVRAEERVHSERLALHFAGIEAPTRPGARFEEQARALAQLMQTLPAAQRSAIEAQLPLVHAALHKRVVLASLLRDRVPEAELAAWRLGETMSWGLGNYARILGDERLRRALTNSLLLASCSTLLVVSLAFCLAYAVQRARIPGARVVRVLALLPLVSPPVLIAFALLLLGGRQGIVSYGLLDQTLGLIDAQYSNIYGFGGVVLAQVIGLLPPAYVILDNALARQDGSLEEAALSAGARYSQVLARVTLPMALPALVRAALISFVLSMTDFGNPEIIGRGFPVLAGEVLDLILGTREFPLAAALCVSLLAPGLTLYFLSERYFRKRRYDAGTRASVHAVVVVPPGVRRALGVLGALLAVVVVALFGIVVASAFTVYWGVDFTPTLAHFLGERPDLQDPTFAGSGFGTRNLGLESVWTSLQVASLAAPLGGLLALITVYTLDRLRPPGAGAFGFIALLPAVFPGIIFGIGYLLVFNNPLGRPELALTGGMAILVLCIVFSNLFVGILSGRTVLQKVSAGLDDAAASLGAGPWQRFHLVLLPLMRQAFILGALYIFIDAMTTLSSVIFLVSGQHMLASVVIFNQATGVEYGSAAAKSTTILAIVLIVVAVAFSVERRLNRLLRQHVQDKIP